MTAPTVIDLSNAPATGASPLVSARGRAGLRERVPGQGVMERLLLCGEPRRPRSVVGRAVGLHPLRAGARLPFARAIGARAVAQRLAALGPAWTVLHSVPAGRGAGIDHLVVGPAGVFAITVATSRLPDAARVDAEARRVAAIVDEVAVAGGPTVRALVVVAGARPFLPRRIGSAFVLRAEGLSRVLEVLPARFEADETARIVAAVERDGLWPAASVAEPELLRRFSVLQRQVDAARRLRHGWQIAGAVGVVSALFLLLR